MWYIPLIVGILWRAGGTDQWSWCPLKQKLWRWFGVGIVVSLAGIITGHGWFSLWCILTYYGATNIPYGERSPLRLLGGYFTFGICGLAAGAASIPVLGLWLGITQAIVSAIGFMVLYYLDESGIVKNPFQEILRGVVGTILFIFA